MKQLTRDEIIELRARVIYNADNLTSVNWEDYYYQRTYIELAKATIEADEKAGVLVLAGGEGFMEGDVIQTTEDKDVHPDYRRIFLSTHNYGAEIKEGDLIYHTHGLNFKRVVLGDKIIQRNNTPVYQCKKEVCND